MEFALGGPRGGGAGELRSGMTLQFGGGGQRLKSNNQLTLGPRFVNFRSEIGFDTCKFFEITKI